MSFHHIYFILPLNSMNIFDAYITEYHYSVQETNNNSWVSFIPNIQLVLQFSPDFSYVDNLNQDLKTRSMFKLLVISLSSLNIEHSFSFMSMDLFQKQVGFPIECLVFCIYEVCVFNDIIYLVLPCIFFE